MPEAGELVGGKYTLIRRLGRGGMGAVYEAVHEQIGKSVAVKVLLPADVDQAELVTRFHQEAQAASASGHRGIVDIYDIGVCDDGAPYLVMELLQGQSLAELLAAAGSLEIARTAFIVCQVLSALSAAHQAGIVHRDLKPENIFLADSGAPLPEVKLLDFGISRIIAPGAADQVSRMTRSGVVMGTPLYMSPEQAAGKKDIDHTTDLYSIAVILYQCLTAKFPHDEDNYNALMASIIADAPIPPTKVRSDLPPPLETIILRGLDKDRSKRYGTASEMFYELRPYVGAGAIASLRAPVSPDGHGVLVPTVRENEGSISGEEPTVYAQDTQPPPQHGVARDEQEEATKDSADRDASWKQGQPVPIAVPATAASSPPRRRRGVLAFVTVAVLFGLVLGGSAVYMARRSGADEPSRRDSEGSHQRRTPGRPDRGAPAKTLTVPDAGAMVTAEAGPVKQTFDAAAEASAIAASPVEADGGDLATLATEAGVSPTQSTTAPLQKRPPARAKQHHAESTGEYGREVPIKTPPPSTDYGREVTPQH